MTEPLRWFAARAKAGHERVALDNLARQHFEAYFPRITIERVRAGRVVTESEGLFPSYVLVRTALEVAAWRAINSTRGIIRLLSFCEDGRPSPIPDHEIDRLKQRESSGELSISEVVRIQRGDRVRLKFGNAVDQIGTVLHTRAERVALLLSLLGRQVKVTAPMHALEIVGRKANDRAVAFHR